MPACSTIFMYYVGRYKYAYIVIIYHADNFFNRKNAKRGFYEKLCCNMRI